MPRSDKVASLLDENQRLRAQLKRCDVARQQAERQVEELQSRVRRKETEWMAEYDQNVQALLEIIKHNEEEKEQLKESVETWRKAAEAAAPVMIKVTRSSQTETSLRLEKTAQKTNSVRFAQEKEERPSVDAKTKVNIARMQMLFEQLQVSRDQRSSKSVYHTTGNADTARSNSEGRSVELGCSFKTVILKRLQNESSVVQQQSSKSTGKTIETQTDDISAPKQESPSVSLQQDLDRLVNERLTSQQKILDHLLCSKLQQASGNPEQNDLVPFTASETDFAANSQSEAQNKCEQRIKPAKSVTSSLVIQIESAPATTDRRPLSPLAA